MNLLSDTRAVLWFVWDDARLSEVARETIEDTANLKFVSIATCWEVSIKCGLDKLSLGEPAATFLPRELSKNGFHLLGITLPHAAAVELLPRHHRDPFDRLLIAQTQLETFALVSCDQIFDRYGINRKW